jgi:hypothetical protein
MMPRKDPNHFSTAKSLLNPSTTRRNRRGKSGQPCIKPLSDLKKFVADPFMRTEKVTVVIHQMIHLINGIVKPKCVKRNRK